MTAPADLVAERGRRLLAELPRKNRAPADMRPAVRACWRDYGLMLQALRAQYPQASSYRRAIDRNGWGAPPASNTNVRTDALWLAQSSEAYAASCATRHCHPTSIRRWWEHGQTAEDDRIAKAVKLASEAEYARLRKLFNAAVQSQVDERLAVEREKLSKAKLAAEEVLIRNRALGERINALMTEDEFDLIRGLLHPDRHPEDRQERFARAFQIFSALRLNIDRNMPIDALRAQGWTIYGKERAARRA
jgi:hypothetical protein